MGSPLCASSCRSQCVHEVKDALQASRGAQSHSSSKFGSWDQPSCACRPRPFLSRMQWCRLLPRWLQIMPREDEEKKISWDHSILLMITLRRSRCARSCTSLNASPPWYWTSNSCLKRRGRCWREPSRPKWGGVKAQCAPLLSFLRAAAVEGSAIPSETADLEVVAPDKALETQRMEILQRDLSPRFDTGASGAPSPGDAMTLALTAFEACTDMIKRTRAASNSAPRAVIARHE